VLNTLRTKRKLLKTQSVPLSKHSVSVIKKNDHFMLYREIIAVCFEIPSGEQKSWVLTIKI